MTVPTRFWIWVPVAGLALVALVNLALIIVTWRIRPTRVEDHPYLASAAIDEDKERTAAFLRAGLSLEATTDRQGLHLMLTCPAGMTLHGPASIALWRPDDPDLDATISWNDLALPATIPLSRPGRFRVRLELPAGPGWPRGARHEMVIDR